MEVRGEIFDFVAVRFQARLQLGIFGTYDLDLLLDLQGVLVFSLLVASGNVAVDLF